MVQFLDLVTSSALSNNNSKRQVDKSSSFSGSGLRDLPLDSDRTLEYISEMQALMIDFAPKEKSHWKYICEEFSKRFESSHSILCTQVLSRYSYFSLHLVSIVLFHRFDRLN